MTVDGVLLKDGKIDGVDPALIFLKTDLLGDIADVEITTPADAEVLTYESATSKWKNKQPRKGFLVYSLANQGGGEVPVGRGGTYMPLNYFIPWWDDGAGVEGMRLMRFDPMSMFAYLDFTPINVKARFGVNACCSVGSPVYFKANVFDVGGAILDVLGPVQTSAGWGSWTNLISDWSDANIDAMHSLCFYAMMSNVGNRFGVAFASLAVHYEV